MAQHRASDGWDSPANRASIVEVVIEAEHRRGAGVRRASSRVAAAAAVAIAVVAGLAELPGTGRRAMAGHARPSVAVAVYGNAPAGMVPVYANAPAGMVPVYADTPAAVGQPYPLLPGCRGSGPARFFRGYRRARLLRGYRPVTRGGVQVASCALRNIP